MVKDANEAHSFTVKTQEHIASGADVEPFLSLVEGAAKSGHYSVVAHGIMSLGQFLRLRQLGFEVNSVDSTLTHTISWVSPAHGRFEVHLNG